MSQHPFSYVFALLLFVPFGCKSGSDAEEVQPVVRATLAVDVVPLKSGAMSRKWTAFGTVKALSSAGHAYSLPYEVRITQVHVAPGQHVDARASLFTSGRSPQTAVGAQNAVDLLKEASENLEQVKAGLADGLATREALILAEGRKRRAEQAVTSMKSSGQLSTNLTTKSLLSGVVSQVHASVGALVPAGQAIVTLSEDSSKGVELWTEPDDAPSIVAGMPVTIDPVFRTGGESIAGQVLRVSENIDSEAHQVSVSVTVDKGSPLRLGEEVKGGILSPPEHGFVVPREALVVSSEGAVLYVVLDGQARARPVSILVDSGATLLVEGKGLSEDQLVITRGAYQAEDGLLVEVQPWKSK